MHRQIDIEQLCADKGLRITEQRRIIARVLGESRGPSRRRDAARARRRDRSATSRSPPSIAPSACSRRPGILERHEFGDGRSRYEAASDAHHDHLIDVETGKVIEFVDEELEMLQRRIAEKLGFRLVDHRMELYGVAIDRER